MEDFSIKITPVSTGDGPGVALECNGRGAALLHAMEMATISLAVQLGGKDAQHLAAEMCSNILAGVNRVRAGDVRAAGTTVDLNALRKLMGGGDDGPKN